MKVLVCGGRKYDNRERVFEVLDALNLAYGVTAIIAGGATGADQLAYEWSLSRLKSAWIYPAKWDSYGKAAGPIRNAIMLREGKPDLVVAFPGGRGTKNMIQQAIDKGVKVERFK